MAAGQGSHLGALYKERPRWVLPHPCRILNPNAMHKIQTEAPAVLIEVGPRGPLIQFRAITWVYGHSQVCS